MSMDKEITDDNRNDYISMLLDKMFNGSAALGGIGNLNLILNEEGTFFRSSIRDFIICK